MVRQKIASSYSEKFLEPERPQTLSDNRLETAIFDILNGKLDKDISDSVYDNFKSEAENWILQSTLNNLKGLESFPRKDIIIGCTQFIDNLYMKGPVQVLKEDYRYHQRLGYATFVETKNLLPSIPLIIAMPFPQIGAPHPNMEEILHECLEKDIPVHIDGAWITCCKNVDFNFDHPAIKSVGISLSKGLGLGWNRIGLRWSRQTVSDSITIMNDFNMNNRSLAMIGLYFIRNFEPDYLWKTHQEKYFKVCRDFNLTATQSIHLALRDGFPVGVSPLIRYLENAK